MGLLDDAIREHLDLKRRRGADPAEIERAEREALGPVRRNRDPALLEEEPEGLEHEALGLAGDEPDEPVAADLVEQTPDVGLDSVEEDADAPATRVMRAADIPAMSDATAEYDVEDAFADVPERAGQAGSDVEPGDAENEDEDEDVLEETPEFLQDTPDHDRLWFEQRPPRDFDFDG
jgi:hypothetical protein